MQRSDDVVVEAMRVLIADHGSDWAENYDLFLADNRTFDGYWEDGVDAIRDNTVEMLVFGRECMLTVGRQKEDALFAVPGATADQSNLVHDILCDLAIAMDRAVSEMTKLRK